MSLEEVEEQNVGLARQVFEAFNTGDVSRVHEFVEPEYFNHESQADPRRAELRGPEEFIDTIKNLRSAFSDIRYEEKETVASRDKVVSIVQVSGKHVGNFLASLRQGAAFPIRHCTYIE